MRTTTNFRKAVRTSLLAFVTALLVACGGGGGSDDSPGVVALPASVSVTAPADPQALGQTLSFSATPANPAFSYHWDFGDGATSTLLAPTHAYAKAGVYTVRLTLGNDAGGSVGATASVSVADFAVVAGKSCIGASQSGWCWQRPLPQGNAVFDYDFIDDSHGWAVGAGGIILTTSDGGITWSAQPSGTSQALRRVKFANGSVGWIAGSNGEMLRTGDGGASWQRVSSGQNSDAQSLGVQDADTAWIGVYGPAYVTVDGGMRWQRIVGPPDSTRVVTVSSTEFWSLPYYGSQTAPSHSLDGGATWQPALLPATQPGLIQYESDLSFFDAAHGLLVGSESGFAISDPSTYVLRQTLLITADGGASWQHVNPPPSGFYSSSVSLIGPTTILSFDGYTVRISSDLGVTWQVVSLPPSPAYYIASVKGFSAQRLVVIDALGQAYLTTDAGAHWNVRSAVGAATASVNSLWFFDAREGLAIADDGSSTRTFDGGQTWVTAAAAGGYGYGWRRVQFAADASVGWVISDTGTIYRSTDKGHVWLAPTPASSDALNSVTDFHFVDGQHGWAVSPYDYSGKGSFFSTVDGGASWQAIASTGSVSGYVSIRFADAQHGVAVGPFGIALVTSDAGVTWLPRPTGIGSNLRRVAFVDAATAVAVGDGGAIVRSTDKGQTWSPVASPTSNSLSDVRFVTPLVGHAVGDAGTTLITRDGGSTWTLGATGPQANLRSVFFVDPQTGWTSGDGGSILATATGGT